MNTPRWTPLAALCVALLAGGCASFDTDQKDISTTTTEPDGTITTTRTITTKASAITVAAGEQKLANWKAGQTDKSQTASVGSMSQQSDASVLVEAAARGAAAGAMK